MVKTIITFKVLTSDRKISNLSEFVCEDII